MKRSAADERFSSGNEPKRWLGRVSHGTETLAESGLGIVREVQRTERALKEKDRALTASQRPAPVHDDPYNDFLTESEPYSWVRQEYIPHSKMIWANLFGPDGAASYMVPQSWGRWAFAHNNDWSTGYVERYDGGKLSGRGPTPRDLSEPYEPLEVRLLRPAVAYVPRQFE